MLAEDSVLLREGLLRLLDEARIEVLAAVADGPALVDAVQRLEPDLAIVDVRMPPSHTDEGLRAAMAIRGRRPSFPILVLSQYIEAAYADELLAGAGGFVGYLLKDRVADLDAFLDAIERVASGGTVLDEQVVVQLLARRRADEPLASLTPRERDVLQLMAQGRSNAAIARALVVTDGAVEKHVQRIFGKLGLLQDDEQNRRVLAVLAYLKS